MADLSKASLDKTKVYVTFTTGNGVLARLIKFFSKSKYSHACLVHWSDQWNGWLAMGAEDGGMIYTPIERNGVVDMYELPIDLWPAMAKNRSQLGIAYDFSGLLGMSVVEVFRHWFKRKIHNPLNKRSAWFCSEFVAKVLEDAGMPLGLTPGDTDPQVVKDALVKLPGVKLAYHIDP